MAFAPLSLHDFVSTNSEPAERSSAATGSNQANLVRGRNGYFPNMLDSRLQQGC